MDSNDPTFDPDRVRAYERGFRNGRLDAFLGHRSAVALSSPDADYASGYRDGTQKGKHLGARR
jgi:hypothetical protein